MKNFLDFHDFSLDFLKRCTRFFRAIFPSRVCILKKNFLVVLLRHRHPSQNTSSLTDLECHNVQWCHKRYVNLELGQKKKYLCLGLHSKFWKGSVGRIYFLFFIPFFDIQYLLGFFLRSLRRTLPTLPALTQTHTSLQPHLPSLWDQGAKWSKECKTIYSTGALTNLVQVHPGKISCTAWLRRTEEEHQSQLM